MIHSSEISWAHESQELFTLATFHARDSDWTESTTEVCWLGSRRNRKSDFNLRVSFSGSNASLFRLQHTPKNNKKYYYFFLALWQEQQKQPQLSRTTISIQLNYLQPSQRWFGPPGDATCAPKVALFTHISSQTSISLSHTPLGHFMILWWSSLAWNPY